jgi:integrase
MASAEKLASGRYRGVYHVKIEGKWKKQHTKKPHFERKRDAVNAAQELEVKARRQAEVTAGTLSASIKWGNWWDLVSEKRAFDSDTPYTEDWIVEGYLRPQWGEVPLNEIAQAAVQDWVDDLVVGNEKRNVDGARARFGRKSPGYVHRIYSVFNVSITSAVKKGVLGASPCVGIDLPKRPKVSRPYMSVARAEQLGGHLRDDYKDAVDFDLETGLRPGELCGLHVERIDLEVGWMEVHDVFVRRSRIIRQCPKDQDVRLVALSDQAIEIVERRIAGRDLNRGCGVIHADRGMCRSDVLFRTRRDRVMSPDTLGERLRLAARKAGVAARSPYTMRRGAATRMAAGGLDAVELARQFGWADINQAWSYVQQTPAARGRVLAALKAGEAPELRVIPGGRQTGTRTGTHLDSAALSGTERVAR